MSPEVAGLTILAIGNGAPDLSTTISSLALSRPLDIVTGSLFGAAIFVVTIVVAAIVFIGRHVIMDAPSFLRDVSFYIVAMVGVYFTTWDGRVYMWEAILFVVYYLIYLAFALTAHYCGWFKGKRDHKISMDLRFGEQSLSISSSPSAVSLAGERYQGISEYEETDREEEPLLGGDKQLLISPSPGPMSMTPDQIIAPVDDEDMDETPFSFTQWKEWLMTKSKLKRIWVVFATIIKIPFYLSIPTIKWNRYSYPITIPGAVVVSVYALGFLDSDHWLPIVISVSIAAALGILVFIFSKWEEPPVYKPAFTFLAFVISIAWIFLIANKLVGLLQSIGIIFGIPDFILGATVLAWGNSVGDFLADAVMAKKGFPGMALSAAYGGPMLNMLIGMGIGLIIRSAKIWPQYVTVAASKSFLATGAFLFFALYATLVVAWIRRFKLSWWWGIFLVVVYLSFSVVTILIEVKAIWKS